MTRYFLFAALCAMFIAGCGNNTQNDVVTNPDSTLHSRDNMTTAPADTSAAAGNQTPFKNIMDGMMQDMHKMTKTNDPDHDFALMMKRHHEAAIEMSNLEITKGSNEQHKQLAQKIMADARKDVEALNSFLVSRKPVKQSDFAKKAMDVMMQSPQGSNTDQSGDTDQQFLHSMAVHHRQGIDMAKEYLKTGTQQPTKKVAENVIKTNSEDLPKLKAGAGS